MSDAEPSNASTPTDRLAEAIAGLELRNIGPAFMGGRIADLAIHPDHPNRWFLAVGSGGVWRSDNAGITWKPLFDDQASYSIGCIRIDPSQPQTIWVGTGEAVSGRHVAWGDGVYRSDDAGETWTAMGLAWSEHVSDILIDPRDSQTVYVAAEGPLWSSGGERGLFKTTDGGATWDCVLSIDEDTGVTSAVFAPDDPDTLYAATYQRRRRVWSFAAGGEGSGIHTSTDGGATWRHATQGLPKSDMGRIGLAVTPANPALLYATIEAADEDERGFYRSTDRGRTWDRRNKYLSGGTGPHYYQEIFASPTNPETVYQVDVFLHATKDGGTTFRQVEDGKHKHSDNHVVWIDPDNDRHLIVGCDAGLYESFDEAETFRHVSNLPISQFYRVAVDNAVPFTNVLAGAQDLGTLRGPTRTMHIDGVRNQDWSVVLGADGYHAAFDPNDDEISYVSWQTGNVMRHDTRTMELADIRPEAAVGEPPERWGWDAPLIVGQHRPDRVYVASHRVWCSDDRGNSWTPISPDLTTGQNRYELPIAGPVASVDALHDHMAMSHYATITALAESPLVDGLLYAGTDDGRIQVSEDGGDSWRRCATPPGLAPVAFINDLEPSRHDSDVVYVAADDHKSGDYSPYLFVSSDRGRTWKLVTGDLPESTTTWAIEQDPVEANLLFLGAEHGLHVSIDGGDHWHRFSKGVPTISFRDLAIQGRDADLVCASFGRGIYVLDNYAPLRELAQADLGEPATIFSVRDAWWYVPYQPMQGRGQPTLGSTAFRAPNPAFGATFTYHLADDVLDAKSLRRRDEKTLAKDGDDIPFPGWERLREEQLDPGASLMLVIRDADGSPLRTLAAETKAGLHRTTWDLRCSPPGAVDLTEPGFRAPWEEPLEGLLAAPGRCSVELVGVDSVASTTLAGPVTFKVVAVPGLDVKADADEIHAFRRSLEDLARRVAGAAAEVDAQRSRIKHLRAGIAATPGQLGLHSQLDGLHRQLEAVAAELLEDPVRARLDEPQVSSIRSLVERVADNYGRTTGAPTTTQRATIDRASAAFASLSPELRVVVDGLRSLALTLDDAGGPWTPR